MDSWLTLKKTTLLGKAVCDSFDVNIASKIAKMPIMPPLEKRLLKFLASEQVGRLPPIYRKEADVRGAL